MTSQRRSLCCQPRIVAPHSGQVSNFCFPVGPVIERMGGHCFQSDPCEPLAGVHGGHPGWTRLELAKGARGKFRMALKPAGAGASGDPMYASAALPAGLTAFERNVNRYLTRTQAHTSGAI